MRQMMLDEIRQLDVDLYEEIKNGKSVDTQRALNQLKYYRDLERKKEKVLDKQ